MNIVKAGTHSIGTSFHYLLSLDMWFDYAFLSMAKQLNDARKMKDEGTN